MTAVAAFRAPGWLPGGHLQTVYPALFAPRPAVLFSRERWDTPDRDFIDLDWLAQPIAAGESPHHQPLVVLFHGLEGSSRSHYSTATMAMLCSVGWDGVVPHFRGCSGEPNRLRRAYHSGDSDEIDWVLRRIRATYPHRTVFALGISLGGNALLKWLGEQAEQARLVISAAAAVCAPADLAACGNTLDRGANLAYVHHFLRTMKRKTLIKLTQFPDICDRRRLSVCRTLREFDNLITAPLHGFRDTDDYWRRASSKPLLGSVAIPTLLLNAENDPFIPRDSLPNPRQVSAHVTLDYRPGGGHVGFVQGRFPGNLGWMPKRIVEFFRGFAEGA